MQNNSFTHTNWMDIDVSSLKPMPNKVIVYVDEDEMLRIGNTNLVMGYWEENRNTSHWFGNVIAKHDDVPLEIGDRVLYSFFSAKGCDRIISFGKLYIILDFSYIILFLRDGKINMVNDHYLSVNAPAVKHETLDYEIQNLHLAVIHHAPKDSEYVAGDTIYYLLDKVFELEGQRKTLGENYRVLRKHNIWGRVHANPFTLDDFDLREGYMLIEEAPQEKVLKSGIVVPDTAKKKVVNVGTVVKSSCGYEEGIQMIFGKTKAKPIQFKDKVYLILEEQYAEAIGE